MEQAVIAHASLSALAAMVQDHINSRFRDEIFWVVADVTDHAFKDRTCYHYFNLVEKDPKESTLIAKIQAKAWGRGHERIYRFESVTGQRFTNNIQVLVAVKVVYHPVYGLSLDLQDIDPQFTLGQFEIRRREILDRLVREHPDVIQKEGDTYKTRNSRLLLPLVIKHIAIVASKTSAGNEDLIHTLENNLYGFRFEYDVYHTIVQNETYSQQFVDALEQVQNSGINYDAVVINRGGGAQTDFLIFDTYEVGLAIARFQIPILTGIGHQKNETIADLMAHTPLKTPTKAAEFMIAHNKQYQDQVQAFEKSIVIHAQRLLSISREQVHGCRRILIDKGRTLLVEKRSTILQLNSRIIDKVRALLYKHRNELQGIAGTLMVRPQSVIYKRSTDLLNVTTNLKGHTQAYMRNQRGYLGHFITLFRMMAPDAILKRGFAYVKHRNKVVVNTQGLQKGDAIEVVMEKETLQVQLTSKNSNNGSAFNV